MRWVTRDLVHFDRVMSAWLIKRYIDKEAEFAFVPFGKEDTRPADAMAFSIPGAEIPPHDENGTTFDKLIEKYGLAGDPALERMRKVCRGGVEHVMHGYYPDEQDAYGQVGVGLLAVAEGMIMIHRTDQEILEGSFPIYDALHANFQAEHLRETYGKAPPPGEERNPMNHTLFVTSVIQTMRSVGR